MGAIGPVHIVVLAIGLAIYMTPGILALARNHPQRIAILLLNFFLGWSVLAWVGALVWALISPKGPAAA